MISIGLRSLFARRLRVALTLAAVALGVALMSATYIFTDTINASFDRIFEETNRGVDAAVTAKQGISNQERGGTTRTVPFKTLEQVRKSPGVAAADASVFDTAAVLGKNGRRITQGGAPSFVSSSPLSERFQNFKLEKGRFPRTDEEAVLDGSTAKRKGFTVGQRMTIQGVSGRRSYLIVGIGNLAGASSFGGATVVQLTLDEAVAVLGKDGYDNVSAAADPGVTPTSLVRSLRERLSPSLNVRTGEQEAASLSRQVTSGFTPLRTALLAFSAIALFVGAFIIFNSFSITVQQRLREFALLRTLGAERRQILASVTGEGIALGVIGSLLGLGLGMILAPGLRALLSKVGIDLPSSGLIIHPRTIIVPLALGTLVATVASFAPALRATRVSPITALRQAAAPVKSKASPRGILIAAALLTLGLTMICLGLFISGLDSARLPIIGGGVALSLLGVALLSPLLVPALASIIGRPIEKITGMPGRLARGNAVRLPTRTAATAAALMVGVSLVSFATVFASGAKSTIGSSIEENLKAQLVVVNSDGFSPFSPSAMRTVSEVPGVDLTGALTSSRGGLNKEKRTREVTGVNPETLSSLYRVNLTQGSPKAVAGLARGKTVIISRSLSEEAGLKTGDRVKIRTPLRRTLTLRVSGVLDDKTRLFGDLVISNASIGGDFGEQKDNFGLARVAAGASLGTVLEQANKTLAARFPEAEVQTRKQFVDKRSDQVNQLLGLIYALLSLAVIISLFGIVNTLILSISERTREIGMLRAIGMSRRQVRRMIRAEAVIVAVIGGIIGSILGVLLAFLFTRPIDGFVLSIPWGQLILLVLLSAAAGIVAAALPARRAARLNVLEAISDE